MTEKECKKCYEAGKRHEYGHVKHCMRDNVTDIEDNSEE